MNAFHASLRGATGLLVGLTLGSWAAADDAIDYNRDVRPILSDHCFACHGPDKNRRKADLRLDLRDSALAQGAVAPGKPDESELVARVTSTDPDEVMPPPKANKPLSAAQKEVLRRWVAAGAPYAAHWAYTPLVRPAVPAVKTAAPVRNPIDAFVQARLAARGLAPAPEADRRTLIRRLSLDLVGLPPTPGEVRAFLDDADPKAYVNLVKRLLASPRYGERMAVPWLDVVRYADTVGFHGDQNQNAWAYRDWVVDAFNANMPFDRFTAEQLAGDLLPGATDSQRVATCFNRLNMMTREGGAQPKEYLAKYAADRVRTVGMAWLGSTLGCCECHDHKFDPFTARDFYSLSAFFADVQQWGVYQDYGYTPNPDLRGFTNDHPFPPEIVVASPALGRRTARLGEQIAAAVAGADPRLAADPKAARAFDAWRASVARFLDANPSGWESPLVAIGTTEVTARAKPTDPPPAPGPVPVRVANDDGSVTVAARGPTTDAFRLRPTPGFLAAVRVELLPAGGTEPRVLRPGVAGGTVRLRAAIASRGAANPRPVAFRAAGADRFVPQYQNGFAALGVLGGWTVDAATTAAPPTAVWLPDRPVPVAEGDTLEVTLQGNPAARVRVSVAPVAPGDVDRPAGVDGLAQALRGGEAASSPVARAAYLRSTAWDGRAFARVATLEAAVRECRGGTTPVMVTRAVAPATTRVLPRGNWQDESGPVVEPAVPRSLPQPEAPAGGGRLTRLDLARWLTSRANPLTARVFANRLWKQFLGTGLSAQVDDLGAQGEWPIHPELLDWLAAEFRDGGWDVKHLVGLIVTSHTYRQSSNPSRAASEVDPNNRLLASQSPRRLEAEFVRDNALTVAGLIDLEAGGPPSFPYQPPGYYANLQFPDREYLPDRDERQYRRGVYAHWQRTFLHPMLAAFDAPSREDCVAARTAANSPQQALTLLNDPEFVEAARVLAARLLTAPAGDDAARVALAYERALARPPTADESRSLLRFLGKVRADYRAKPDDARKLLAVGNAPAPDQVDPAELAAWGQVCRVILNLHETITRY